MSLESILFAICLIIVLLAFFLYQKTKECSYLEKRYKGLEEDFQLSSKRKHEIIKEKTEQLESEIKKNNALVEQCSRNEELLSNIESDYQKLIESNVTSIPWLAGMMGDFMTYEMELIAREQDWGWDQRRMKRVATIREIRAEASQIASKGKEAIYQLEYLRALFPNIDDYLESDYKDIFVQSDISDFDPVRNYLSKEEWDNLSDTEKNQLALDRYIESQKTKWQIGRDYELSVAYEYQRKGYNVDTYGSYMQLEDHGRDLIAEKDGKILIIQCKYWSSSKQIHEKHIYQLYGSVVSFCIENRKNIDNVAGVFVTNITLSPFAKKAANYLHISVVQNHEFVEFPRIKCNIGRNEFGGTTRIYHLPMDDQYDKAKICNKGEFYAFTVEEAEKAGFRRAYKWHGQQR